LQGSALISVPLEYPTEAVKKCPINTAAAREHEHRCDDISTTGASKSTLELVEFPKDAHSNIIDDSH